MAWRVYEERNGFTLMVGVNQFCPNCGAAREAFASHGPRYVGTVTHGRESAECRTFHVQRIVQNDNTLTAGPSGALL